MNYIHENNKIYLKENDTVLAEVTFPTVSDQVVDINHTFVDPSLRGQGIAGKLMEEAVAELKAQNVKAKLSCSFAIRWFEEHPEHADLLA